MRILSAILSLLVATAALGQTPGRGSAIPLAPAGTAGVFDATLDAQVMLDRAGFSPGEIDGRAGANFTRALIAFQRARGIRESGQMDESTRERLIREAGIEPTLVEYLVTEADVAGPFTRPIPSDLVAQSRLKRLYYESALEAVAERFHASPQLLQRLNNFGAMTPGQRLMVPNVSAFELPGARDTARPDVGRAQPASANGTTAPAFTIVVTGSTSALTVEDSDGRVVFHAPVSTGSDHDPLPIGNWKVTTVQVMPRFHYNPDLFWDADPSHSKATIQPGPNNPVGVAWIDLSKEHYGIHGTPTPSRIGYVQSHGCVRLTNWDVARLMVWAHPGTPVIFRD